MIGAVANLSFQILGVSPSTACTLCELTRCKTSTNPANQRYYLFNGNLLLGELDKSGTPIAAYTSGADGLVSERLIALSASRYYHFGPQGETRQLTDATGTITDTYAYTAYGIPLSATGTSVNPHRYGGKFGYFWESFNGVLLAGYRWYNPYLGRWMSRDPIGYEGGVNLYEYVGGPTIFVDPDGLLPESVWTVADGIVGFGDGLTGGATGWIRDRIAGEEIPVGYSNLYPVGQVIGFIWPIPTAGVCVAERYGFRTKIMLHDAHHYFKRFDKRLPHFQLNTYWKGSRRSHKNYYLPLPKYLDPFIKKISKSTYRK